MGIPSLAGMPMPMGMEQIVMAMPVAVLLP